LLSLALNWRPVVPAEKAPHWTMSTEAALPNGTGIVGNAVVEGKREGSQSRWRNDSEAGWVVQKFGGTSVGKFAVNIAEDIVR
jgi:aspartate kinase